MDVNSGGGDLLPGDSYPDWLTFSFEGSSVTFEVPKVEGRNLKMMMCIVYTSTHISTPDNIKSYGFFYQRRKVSNGLRNVLVKNYTKATIQLYNSAAILFENEWKRVISSIEPGNKVEVVFVFKNDFIVKKTAIYLVYDAPDLNLIACRGDDSECSKEELTDDFNQKRKKKDQVE